jgi:hypothetical protein
MYVYKTYNPSEPVRKVRYWATKESRQDYLRYLSAMKDHDKESIIYWIIACAFVFLAVQALT